MNSPSIDEARAIADTVRWLERAVIGLQLCPFAKAVHARGQIHYAVHAPAAPDELVERLLAEAAALWACDPSLRDTSLVIAPNTLGDFLDFHAVARQAERRLAKAGFDGLLQLASFHPRFCFADAQEDDIANATNRAPYPTLQLLREESVGQAVDGIANADTIYQRNIETLRQLGPQGWARLDVGPRGAPS